MTSTYKSYDSMTSPERLKMAEAARESYDSSSCDSTDAPIERKSRLRETGFFGYPPYMALLLLMELCERFSFYGIRSILAIYFTKQLDYTNSEGTSIYHGYIVACYLTPILGGIIADQYWGKYKTILLLSIVYAFGNAVISGASTLAAKSDSQAIFTFVGLGLIALGTGGIKPCVSSFCGDQLDPKDQVGRERFFSIFYACINVGAVISSYLTPKLRQQTCMGKDTCYPLALGIPSILMFIALGLFIAGTKLYIRNKVKSDVFTQFVKTVAGVNHKATYDFRRDCKRMVAIFKIILPISIFWAIFDQAGSTYTYQAAQLDKSIYSLTLRKIFVMPSGWFAEDQIEAINPIILLALIPVFNCILYPVLNTFFKVTALRKMTLGLGVNVLVCLIALWLQKRIDKDFTYVFPEYNENSPMAKATLAVQVQYKNHSDDSEKNRQYKYMAQTHLTLKNVDLYDSDYIMDKISVKATGEQVAADHVSNSGRTSPRIWSWHNNTDRQRESIVDPTSYNSRLNDKTSCSTAWKKSLPHIHYKGHSNLDYKKNDHVGYDIHHFEGEKFLLPAGKFTKVLIYPNGHLFPVDVPVGRPKFGRSMIYFYTRQPRVNSDEYFHGRLYCENTHNYDFQRKRDYTPCEFSDGRKDKEIIGDYDNAVCVKDGGKAGEKNTEYNADIGKAPEKYGPGFSINGTEIKSLSENTKREFFLPERNYQIVDTWRVEFTDRLASDIDTHDRLYRAAFMVPQWSKCWHFADPSKVDLTTPGIQIKVNGIYSMVDYTNPHQVAADALETDFPPTPTEDMKPLQHPVIWQVLLYFVATSAEILISISGLEYSYAQAPKSMKAVASSLWLLPVCFGNVYVISVSSVYYFKTHAYKIHEFNGVASIFMTILYVYVAKNYVTAEEEEVLEERRREKEEAKRAGEAAADQFLFGTKA